MSTTLYSELGLDRTVHVGIDRLPEWSSPAVVVAPIERGIDVPHRAANVAGVGARRVNASPHRVVHTQRFAPGSIPAGVNTSITLPHDCENHLDITNEVMRRGW